jgi:nitroimidazol reductase NimA-like FMN-containing flavoprotein (pyridoxamine 5'-phosphate oxidase superfamily)/GNAT superfamily N-acetyltransferase
MAALSQPPLAENRVETRQLAVTPRTTLKRTPKRGSHERAALDAILDEALVCHVGVVIDGSPRVLPTAHVRVGDALYVHGSRKNRLMTAMIGQPVAVTVTLIDGLVMSRSAFHHSMNYRSAVMYGVGVDVLDVAEKRAALHALVEHIAKGRSQETRPPTESELAATLVVRVPIEEGSVKARAGSAIDDEETLGDDSWAGVIPLKLVALAPQRDGKLRPSQQIASSVAARARQLGSGGHTLYERQIGDVLVSTDPGRVDFAMVHAFLRDESYWARGVSEHALRTALSHALCFGVYRGDAQLGFARVVTDFARIAYLGDVFVAPSARGQGLGKLLVDAVLTHPDLRSVERWVLGTHDAHELYARYGFVRAEAGRYMVRRS